MPRYRVHARSQPVSAMEGRLRDTIVVREALDDVDAALRAREVLQTLHPAIVRWLVEKVEPLD